MGPLDDICVVLVGLVNMGPQNPEAIYPRPLVGAATYAVWDVGDDEEVGEE
jgi:hypothetical protein